MAAKETPNSYKDPYWSELATGVEQKLQLPKGLLVGILTRGERSNADQVSEAGAKTPFQIIEPTRKAGIEKYGIDAYLSPENAAEVAGRLLQDSLKRNGGNPAQAVGEYHGGTNRANWGPRTKAYIARVVGSANVEAPADAPAAPPAPSGTGSTFQRVLAAQQAPAAAASIANVFQAYESGQMTPEEAAEFEADVQAGKMMLPRGKALKTPAQAPAAQASQAIELPQAVADAYRLGKMPEADRAELDRDLAAGLVKWPGGAAQPEGVPLPAAVPPGTQTPAATAPMVPDTPTSLGEEIVGGIETGAQLATGAVGGTIGTIGGAAGAAAAAALNGDFGTKQAADMIEQAAAQGGQALTYQPRTVAGQQQAQVVGEVMQNAVPLTGLTGELQALSTAAAPVAQAPRAAVARAGQQVAEAVPAPVANAARAGATTAQQAAAAIAAPISSVTGRVRKALAPSSERKPTPGTGGSAGAAGTDVATMRRANAQDLPVPIDLTEGQATREHGQQQFEREIAKNPEQGAPLRERMMDQNQALLQNFEHFIDQTQATAPTLRAVGTAVDDALVKQYRADKAKVTTAYNRARKSEEAAAAVDQAAPVTIGEGETALTGTPIGFLNDQPTGLPNTALADAARQYAKKLGIAEEVDGQLVPKPTTVAKLEEWRKAIGEAAGYEPADVRTATIMKKLIDGQTEPVAGPLFREARAMRHRLAQNYEDRAVVNQLLTKKRGTEDRRVAFEDVLDHTILKAGTSVDDVREVRRVLQRSGEAGQQAWRELQGATLGHIRDEAIKGVARDSRGVQVVSPAALKKAINGLDVDGKLEVVFGKKGAEQLRVLNEVAQDVLVAPPGTVNTSNTASVILAALDMGMSGAVGAPLPIASGLRLLSNHIKDQRVAKRVKAALGPAGEREPSKF